MYYKQGIIAASLGLILLAACGAVPESSLAPTAEAVAGQTATQITEQTGAISDQASLIAALQQAGATVAAQEAVEQPFLDVAGTQLQVNDAAVQVYEYESPEAAQAAAQQASDILAGQGTTMVNWVASPHFYQQGRLLVLYVGDDAAVLDLLQRVLGAPVAEQILPGR